MSRCCGAPVITRRELECETVAREAWLVAVVATCRTCQLSTLAEVRVTRRPRWR